MPDPSNCSMNDSRNLVSDADLPGDIRARIVTALVIGVVSCMIGPAFLTLCYAYHGIGLGFVSTIAFCGGSYFAPGLLFVAAGLWIGYALTAVCPRLKKQSRDSTVAVVMAISFALCIGLLLNGFLNLGVLHLPAFSIACGLAACLTTSLYLALS